MRADNEVTGFEAHGRELDVDALQGLIKNNNFIDNMTASERRNYQDGYRSGRSGEAATCPDFMMGRDALCWLLGQSLGALAFKSLKPEHSSY